MDLEEFAKFLEPYLNEGKTKIGDEDAFARQDKECCLEKVQKFKMADVRTLEKMKVAELKQVLSAQGLETKGNKSELLSRLKGFLQQLGVQFKLQQEHEDELEDADHEQVKSQETLEQNTSIQSPVNRS